MDTRGEIMRGNFSNVKTYLLSAQSAFCEYDIDAKKSVRGFALNVLFIFFSQPCSNGKLGPFYVSARAFLVDPLTHVNTH